jgi:hypothetical protein
MKNVSIAAVLFAFTLAACGANPQVSRSSMAAQNQVSSGLSDAATLPASLAGNGAVVLESQYDVQAVNFVVPPSLTVSEANTFHPNTDIVWRGDERGDRRVQIKAIFDTASLQATNSMHFGPKVVVDIELLKFHAVTEKTRYTVGGVHNIEFIMSVRDVETGTILQMPRKIIADVKAAGGARADAEEAAGRTQKVVVTERLAQVLRRELSAPASHVPANAVVSRFDGSRALLVLE